MNFVHSEYPFKLYTSAVKIWRRRGKKRRKKKKNGGGGVVDKNLFCDAILKGLGEGFELPIQRFLKLFPSMG